LGVPVEVVEDEEVVALLPQPRRTADATATTVLESLEVLEILALRWPGPAAALTYALMFALPFPDSLRPMT